MFTQINNTLSSVISFSNSCDLTDKMKKFNRTLNYKKFDKLISLINDQSIISNKEYVLYKQKLDVMDFEVESYILEDTNEIYPLIVDAIDDYLLLNSITPNCLAEYIKKNYNLDYIFIPLNYGNNANDNSHQSMIMFDNRNMKIYNIDPNGKSDYFNNIFDNDMSFEIDTLLCNYFSDLKIFNINYEYIYSHVWNNKKIALNISFKNEYVGSGHCVIFSLMLIHLISVLKISSNKAFEMFSTLSESEILFLIKEYSIGMYNIFNHFN